MVLKMPFVAWISFGSARGYKINISWVSGLEPPTIWEPHAFLNEIVVVTLIITKTSIELRFKGKPK